MDDIKSYKVSTGEEIMGRLINEDAEVVTLNRTRIVIMQTMQSGQLGIGFMPFMVSNLADDAHLFLQKTSIVAQQNPSKEIRDAYVKNTTGIEIVSA